VKRLHQTAASQRYLLSVVNAADDFREIREILARYDTLISTHRVRIFYYFPFISVKDILLSLLCVCVSICVSVSTQSHWFEWAE